MACPLCSIFPLYWWYQANGLLLGHAMYFWGLAGGGGIFVGIVSFSKEFCSLAYCLPLIPWSFSLAGVALKGLFYEILWRLFGPAWIDLAKKRNLY